MSILKAWRYFQIPNRVVALPRDLITPFDIQTCDEDELLIILAGKAKDRHAIQRLYKRYGVTSAAQLLPLLPRRKPYPLRQRVMDWLRRIEGSYSYDPQRRQLRIVRQQSRSRVIGITRNKMRGKGTFGVPQIDTED